MEVLKSFLLSFYWYIGLQTRAVRKTINMAVFNVVFINRILETVTFEADFEKLCMHFDLN